MQMGSQPMMYERVNALEANIKLMNQVHLNNAMAANDGLTDTSCEICKLHARIDDLISQLQKERKEANRMIVFLAKHIFWLEGKVYEEDELPTTSLPAAVAVPPETMEVEIDDYAEEVKVALKRKMGDEIMSDFARKWLIVKRRKSTYHETASAP